MPIKTETDEAAEQFFRDLQLEGDTRRTEAIRRAIPEMLESEAFQQFQPAEVISGIESVVEEPRLRAMLFVELAKAHRVAINTEGLVEAEQIVMLKKSQCYLEEAVSILTDMAAR